MVLIVYARSVAARREAFTLARFDRLRVLTTEAQTSCCGKCARSAAVGRRPPIANTRLSSVLWWVWRARPVPVRHTPWGVPTSARLEKSETAQGAAQAHRAGRL